MKTSDVLLYGVIAFGAYEFFLKPKPPTGIPYAYPVHPGLPQQSTTSLLMTGGAGLLTALGNYFKTTGTSSQQTAIDNANAKAAAAAANAYVGTGPVPGSGTGYTGYVDVSNLNLDNTGYTGSGNFVDDTPIDNFYDYSNMS